MYFPYLQLVLGDLILLCLHNVEGRHFASKSNVRCMPGFRIDWIRELGTSPFAATPLIADIDADGSLDVVSASFSGDVNVVNAQNGRSLAGTKWPFVLPGSTVHASPLQFDYNGDGMLDILVFSSQGEVFVLSHEGTQMSKSAINGLAVDRFWYQKILTAEENAIHNYILDDLTNDPSYVTVDPRVLATPALVDLNADGVVEELIIPVTYFYDLDYYSNPEALEILGQSLSYEELTNYLASSLVIMNATDMSVIRTIHMELTKVNSEYPGYLLFPPTLVDLSGSGGPLDIVTGSSAGHLHVFSPSGGDREGFPVPTESIHGQITVEDVNLDGDLDLIMTDTSGVISCYSKSSDLIWETEISGSRPSGSRVADLYGDGRLQVVATTDDGKIWVLDGKTGEVVADWPFKISGTLVAPPTMVKIETLDDPAIATLDSKGYLHILGNQNCRHAVTIKETSLVPVMSHDLIPTNPGLEFLVATKDGALMCISQTNDTGMINNENVDDLGIYSWPGETKSVNNFVYGKYGVMVDFSSVDGAQITATSFSLPVMVIDQMSPPETQKYTIHVLVGSVHLGSFSLDGADLTHSLTIPSPRRPLRGHLVVRCVDRHGKVAESVRPISFHQTVGQDLFWLLVSPTVAMGLLLLFLYGFPVDDLLPTYRSNKNR